MKKSPLAAGHPLFEVVHDAYRLFSFPKPDETGVCVGCCMDPGIEADFLGPDIAELPLEYVRDWFSAATTPELERATWGYLLPRILEILAAGELPANVGLEVSLKRFLTGNRERWSPAQWDVLDRFQRQFLLEFARKSDEFLDDALCMFGIAGWPLDDLFAQVAAWPDELLTERLWHDWCEFPSGSIWLTAFWSGPGRTAAYDFYTSDRLALRMTDLGLAESTEPKLAEKALAVADVIWSSGER